MKNDLVIIIMIAAGAVLIYAAIKNETPADVVRNALGARRGESA